jgi:hypothetical protein
MDPRGQASRLDGAEDAFAEAACLLARARASGVPVFHVMHDAGPGSPYDITAEIGQISSEVAPADGEPVVVKHYPSSFFQTGLGDLLGKTGRPDLVLAGFMTHMCVSSTARDAFNLGYRPTIVASATATRELPVPGGVPVPAATLQTATLAGIADLFTLVVGKPDDPPGWHTQAGSSIVGSSPRSGSECRLGRCPTMPGPVAGRNGPRLGA